MRYLLAAAALLFAIPGFAADKDLFLDHMAGRWVLSGTIENQPTTHEVTAEWILQNTYLRFIEIAREKDAAGKPLYEAEVLLGYDPAKKRYVCFWYDITGVAGPGSGGEASRDGDRLPFVFKSASGDFHTTFAYQSASESWTVAMDADVKGKLVPFAQLTMKKAP
jgi:Protein of unknown function (DUF1579).